jgi:hypothetical protein
MIKMTRIFEFNVRPDLDWVGTRFEPKERKDRFGVLDPGERRCFREQFNLNGMVGTIQFSPGWGKRRVRVTVETIDQDVLKRALVLGNLKGEKPKTGRPGNTWRNADHRTKGKEDEN